MGMNQDGRISINPQTSFFARTTDRDAGQAVRRTMYNGQLARY
ncbi:MAG: hypothetical protein U5K72_09595 [Balneolaceae bacterium]|nr:hypothetical protein [Balneolaceae bacterium]